ncbi:hypothetical protein A6A21_08275 [Phocoenobacter uteri]|nr:hypothetical protein [Phocoenobacter uteri]
MAMPNTKFKMPPPYYLQKQKNNKNMNNGKSGLFRFYTKILKNTSDCDNYSLYGIKQIVSTWYYTFFKNMTVNNQNIRYISKRGTLGVAENVVLP